MAYGIHDLELKGLKVKTILSVHISHEPGEHGFMELTADMGENNLDMPIQQTGNGQKVVLSGKSDGKKTVLFSGVITNLTARSMGKSCHVHLTASSWSYQMDIKKKSRSFQDTSMTYGALVSQVVGEYPDAECQILFADVPLGEIAVQYQETDWQFLKRMLSALYVTLVCSEIRENLCVYAGVAQIPSKMDTLSVEGAWKDMDEIAYWKEMGEGAGDADAISYRIKLDNGIPLFSDVVFRNRQLTAEKIEYLTIGSTVYEFVTIRNRQGIRQRPIYPMQLVGTAFEGTVQEVQGENMKIHLRIDDDYPGNDCYWFPFSTPSASSDGSGWYCMPEIGDTVRVYFPSKKTGDVIAVSAVNERLSSEDAPADWAKDEETGPIPAKQKRKAAAAAETAGRKSLDMPDRVFAGNVQTANPGMMRTMEISGSGMRNLGISDLGMMKTVEISRPGMMKTMEVSRPEVMKTLEISNPEMMKTMEASEPGAMKAMKISEKTTNQTMDVSKTSLGRAAVTAVAFGRTAQIRPAKAFFNKEEIKR